MEPGRDDREHHARQDQRLAGAGRAAMEPGRDDREHPRAGQHQPQAPLEPRWSPVAMTGNTRRAAEKPRPHGRRAAMEPGRDDREHYQRWTA